MPSPFPGMDPYLESPAYWGGLHSKLIVAMNDALNRTLPEGYYAEVDEHVWLQIDPSEDRRLLGKPDVFITDKNGTSGRHRGVVLIRPTVHAVLPKGRRKTHRFVKVIAPDGTTVVTVIEFLCPSNKAADRSKYLGKREEYFGARVNLVEIDLLRDGERMPMGKPSAPGGDYYVFVARSREYPEVDVWQFTVRGSIPPVPIPLKADDDDLPVDLQGLFTEIYDRNRYRKRIDYSAPPVPPLRHPDAEWAADLLKKQKKAKK